jgi:3-oxoacid CoA-transferase
MGGAMDLVSNPDNTKIVVATEHVAKDGTSKIVQNCSLPLTGARVVSTIITDLVSVLAKSSELFAELMTGNTVCF